ncbi:Monodehydroascorbate reductase, chloroplastic/mitochondrial [Turnera subulata]|uniref:Monodehydroascorbate reductase, chloroplastic/mitochondrial n=1 Tax=Turnera subulata TaxID=218843 RepID=A0A9Q0GEV9_9ROSI|nr:Monodehydroascorbate reductase, chloroplastic/mitochondrial [Turnera subulata]
MSYRCMLPLFHLKNHPIPLPGFHICVGSGGERQTPDWYKEKGIEMLYADPIVNIDIEKQTLTTDSGKLLKYGSLIIATGSTTMRFSEKIGGNLPVVHYIRDVGDVDSLISSLRVPDLGKNLIAAEEGSAAATSKNSAQQ